MKILRAPFLVSRNRLSVYLALLVLGISFYSPSIVRAAISGSLYPDQIIAPAGSAVLYAPLSGSPYPFNCTLSGADGTNKQYAKSSAQDPFGPFTVSPTQTTTYTLECFDNSGASMKDTAIVTVSSAPIISTLQAAPTAELPAEGGEIQIYTDISLATSCKHTDGNSQWRAETNYSGRYNTPKYTINDTTTFTLECFNSSGVSSGKKSVTVYVGTTALCGNGVRDAGEQCDTGSNNSNICPTSCTTACQSFFCSSSTVDFQDNFKGASNDVVSCFNEDGQTKKAHIKPGATVTYEWNAKNAKTCTRDMSDALDAPFTDCFPKPTPETPSVSVPIKGSCSVTAPSNLIEGTQQDFSMWCDDGGSGKKVVGAFRIADTNGSQATCGKEPDESDIKITSFVASPNPVPFSNTGTVAFSWQTVFAPADNIPTCSLGNQSKSGSFSAISPSVVGKNGSISLNADQITRDTESGPPGTKEITLRCKVSDNSQNGITETETLLIYFQSDPAATPLVKLEVGVGSDRDADRMVPAGTTVKIYQGVAGAEKCAFTDSRSGTVSLAPFVGEKVTSSIISEPTTFTLECWNGAISSKAVSNVTIGTPPDGGDGGNGDGVTSPTSSTTCAQGSCKGACNTATETPSGTCNSNLGFCCVPKTTTPVVLTSTPWSNPVAFNTVEGLLDKILSYLQGIIVILSLIMIVIGSIIYMTAAGNDSKLSTGKLMITASLVGLALALAAPSFLKEIGEILGWTSTNVTNVQGAKTLLEILQTALNFLLSVIGIIGIIMLVVGGIMYLTAAGNEDRLKTGKAIVTYSLIGIAVALAALVIVTQVIGFFS